jgi:uncharacterized protein (UPF0371 family)
MMLNAVKELSGIPAQIPLIAPNVIQSIAHMKHDILKGGYTSLNLDEALIGLAISCTTNPTAQIATEKLNELRGCEVHMTHIVTPGDEAGLRRLGCRFTSDPYFASVSAIACSFRSQYSSTIFTSSNRSTSLMSCKSAFTY